MTFDELHAATGRSDLGAGPERTSDRARLTWDDPLLYVLGLAVGLVPIVAVHLRGGAWGAEPTVGLVFCIFSAGALLSRLFGMFRAGGHPRRHTAGGSQP